MKSLLIKSSNMNSPVSLNKGYYPSLEIKGEAIPELMKKDIKETCYIKLEVKITAQRSDDRGDFVNVDVISGEYDEGKE